MNGSTLELLVAVMALIVIGCVIAAWLHALKQPERWNSPDDSSYGEVRWDRPIDNSCKNVNPATGFPMMGPNLDIAGNEWGRSTHDYSIDSWNGGQQ